MKKAKAYLNVFKMRMNIKFKRNVVFNYPVAAYMEPTLFCNLRCPACPTGLRLGLRPSVSIEEDLFKSAIDEVGDYIFTLNMYNWGEPLLHKKTPELIRYAKKKDIKIVMSTNLSIKFTDEYIDNLVTSGLDRLIVSLDGASAETYKRYRVSGDFDLVRRNILRIQEAKQRLGVETPRVVWQFLVFKHNEHEIEQARGLYKDWGADEFTLAGAEMPLDNYNDGLEPSTMPEFNVYHPTHVLQREAERQMQSDRPCTWLYGVFVLNPNGKVSPCCAVSGEKHDFGEYSTKERFFEVWNSRKFRLARAMFAGTDKKQNKKLNATQKLAISKRVDGMGVEVVQSLDEEKLICKKCPIPFLQNYTDGTVTAVIDNLVEKFSQENALHKKAGYIVSYLLMGAPDLKLVWQRGKSSLALRLGLSS